jgi:DASS family divalent anion:Na+ symporter
MRQILEFTTNRNFLMLVIFLLGYGVWNLPIPNGISEKAWHMFAIFIATIFAIITNPMPMGASSLIAIMCCVLTGTLTLEECLAGFGSETVWLVVFAFFISLGFIKTGLGSRCAYYFISKFGRSTLGLSYGLVLAELTLSPLIPSVTARGGGIIFPIAKSLCKSYSDENHTGVSCRTSAFIMKVCFQSNVITSSMFLTAMAANPLVVKLAADFGADITWLLWAWAALIPCLVCLVLMPLLVYVLYPPTIKHSDTAPAIALAKLKEMGGMKLQEIIMMFTFVVLIALWIMGGKYGISATATALIGLSILFVTKTINFDDAIADKGAWHTFIWFATLVMLSGYLSKFGLMSVFGEYFKSILPQGNPTLAIGLMVVVYFYMHYMFASATAHITVLFPTFLFVLISYGMPATISALILGFLSILSSGITHFSLASAPIFFGDNHMSTKNWWFVGFVCSAFYLTVLATIGMAWWKIIGLW